MAECRFSYGCNRIGCYFAHPHGRAIDAKMSGAQHGLQQCTSGGSDDKGKEKGKSAENICRFSYSCNRIGCYFAHPHGRAIDAKTSGAQHSLQQCTSGGSDDEGKEKGKNAGNMCRFSYSCTRIGCYFAHPRGRAIDTEMPGAQHGLRQCTSGGSDYKGKENEKNAGNICRFSYSCTRIGCYLAHPRGRAIDTEMPGAQHGLQRCIMCGGGDNGCNGNRKNAGNLCRFGAKCIRADCYFNHPPGRTVLGGSVSEPPSLAHVPTDGDNQVCSPLASPVVSPGIPMESSSRRSRLSGSGFGRDASDSSRDSTSTSIPEGRLLRVTPGDYIQEFSGLYIKNVSHQNVLVKVIAGKFTSQRSTLHSKQLRPGKSLEFDPGELLMCSVEFQIHGFPKPSEPLGSQIRVLQPETWFFDAADRYVNLLHNAEVTTS